MKRRKEEGLINYLLRTRTKRFKKLLRGAEVHAQLTAYEELMRGKWPYVLGDCPNWWGAMYAADRRKFIKALMRVVERKCSKPLIMGYLTMGDRGWNLDNYMYWQRTLSRLRQRDMTYMLLWQGGFALLVVALVVGAMALG